VRFVFPSVSSEGAAFWIVRSAPIGLRDFLWSKFWIGLVPVLVLTEALTIVGNYLLGVDPFLAAIAPIVVLFMSLALVGLATGLGARYPRFAADSATQVAGSYGGIAFMVMAVLFVLLIVALVGWPSSVYLFHQVRRLPLGRPQLFNMYGCFLAAAAISLATWWMGMRTGIRALEALE
jgi:ABC-2 type transport system permease protein